MTFTFYLERDGFEDEIKLEVEAEYVDDSFDYEYGNIRGTEKDGHIEITEISGLPDGVILTDNEMDKIYKQAFEEMRNYSY